MQGDLDRVRAEAIEVHLDGCQDCALVVSDLVRIWSDDMVSEQPDREPMALLPSLHSHEETLTSRQDSGRLGELEVFVLPSGAEVGPYRVLDVVGVGGMGVVYSAYDPELDRRVALKVLRATPAADSDRRNARLGREAQAMAKLSHPNVITVHHVGRSDGRVYIAMEFVEGETLGSWMKSRRRSWSEVRDTFAAAGEGLRAAHDAGLVHRDFKPDNVLIGKDGRVRVTDFGLARFRDDAPDVTTEHDESTDSMLAHLSSAAQSGPVGRGPTLTKTGALVGTPAYMAPEQYEGGRVTAATDQFAFCVAMWEAIYGQRPFAGQTLSELAASVCSGEYQRPEEGAVPGRVARALRRGLSVDPEDRFDSMAALLEIINQRPSRVIRRWAMVTVPSIVAAAALWGYRAESEAEIGFCRDSGAIESVWDDERRDEVESAFTSTQLPYAPQAAETVVRSVDAYAVQWSELRKRLCEEGQLAGLEAGELMTMHCLLERRARLDTLLEVFETADNAVVNRAITAIQGLEPAATCLDAEVGGSHLPAPHPEEAEDVERIREELARAMARADAGKLSKALSDLESLESQASLLRYEPLQAEVKIVLGRVIGKMGQHDRARKILDEAAWLGVESGHNRVCAQAWTEMTFLLAARVGDVEGARRAKRAAEAYLSQSGDDPKLARRLKVYSGTLALADQRFDEAREIYEDVLADDPPDASINRATLLMNLGSVYVMLGQPDDAVEHYRRAVGMFVEQFGRVHPRVAAGYYNLGIVLMQRGILDDAQMQFELAFDLGRSTLGEGHPQLAETANALGLVHLRMGEREEAIAQFETAIKIAGQGKVLPETARDYESNMISALTETGRLDEAARRLDALRHQMDQAESLETSSEISWLVLSSQLSRTRQDWDAAAKTAARALELARGSKDVEPVLRSYALAEQAEVKAHLGEHGKAVSLVREALGPDVLEQIDSLERADLEFQLAGHLAAAGDKTESRRLAEAARTRFDDAALFDEAEEIELWLTEQSR